MPVGRHSMGRKRLRRTPRTATRLTPLARTVATALASLYVVNRLVTIVAARGTVEPGFLVTGSCKIARR
jgi:hypothetical protein